MHVCIRMCASELGCVCVSVCMRVCQCVCQCVCVWFASRLADRLVPNRLRIFAKARGSERERESAHTHTHTHNSIKTLKKKTQDVARSCCSDIYWAVKTRPTVSGRWKKPRKWA